MIVQVVDELQHRALDPDSRPVTLRFFERPGHLHGDKQVARIQLRCT